MEQAAGTVFTSYASRRALIRTLHVKGLPPGLAMAVLMFVRFWIPRLQLRRVWLRLGV